MTIDVTTTDILPAGEAAELEACETVIREGLAQFLAVGNALARIRDARLYRADFATFEDYSRERWGWSRAHAYRMIEAADAVEAMSPIGDTPTIANEAQAREVAAIIKTDGPERAAEILTEVAEDGPVTAKAIRDAAQSGVPVSLATAQLRAKHLAVKVEEARAAHLAALAVVNAQIELEQAAAQRRAAEREVERLAAEAAEREAEEWLPVPHALLAEALAAHGIDRVATEMKFPWQTRDGYHSMREGVRARGVHFPVSIIVEDDGTLTLLDGRVRLVAAYETGRVAPMSRVGILNGQMHTVCNILRRDETGVYVETITFAPGEPPPPCEGMTAPDSRERYSWLVSIHCYTADRTPDMWAAWNVLTHAENGKALDVDLYATTDHGRNLYAEAARVHTADPELCEQVIRGDVTLAEAVALLAESLGVTR